MRYVQILSLLACVQFTLATPISLETRAKGTANSASQASKPSKASPKSTSSNKKNITNDSVSRAADNFAQDAGIVSNAINKMTSMTDQAAIKATAQRAFDAESDEDNQRQVLAAAAGSAGDSANGKIMKFTPTVLDGLDAITKDASPASVMKNTKMMEDPRNANILPSITQLSNAALNAMGLDQTAPDLKSTTGASGNNNNNNQPTDRGTGSTDDTGKNGNSGDNNNNNSNNSGNGRNGNANANDDNNNNSNGKTNANDDNNNNSNGKANANDDKNNNSNGKTNANDDKNNNSNGKTNANDDNKANKNN